MASIPLPALDVRAPQQQPDQLAQIGQIMQLRNAMQEQPVRQQILGQQQQSGALQLQQQQQQVDDQKAMTSAMHEWDGKKLDDLVPLVVKNGGSATAVMGLKQKMLEQQQAYSTIAKNDAETQQNNLKSQKDKNNLIVGALQSVQSMPDDQLASGLTQTAQDLVQRGLLDPQHAQGAVKIAQSGNPAQIRQQLSLLEKGLTGQAEQMENALKDAQTSKANAEAQNAKGKIDPNSPLYSPSADAVAMGSAPRAAEIKAGEVKLAGQKAGAEAGARQPYEMSLARQRQALSQGDPRSAAQLLVDGDATLSELKARGATPEFIQQTLGAAHQMTGGKYNAQEADAQFQVAKSQANIAFFGSAKSLTDPGGTLDQLAKVGQTIPGNQIPAFNSIADWEKAATGNGPLAHYAATALGVADDYAKVMGGGVGSDTSRAQALNIIKANGSPEARAGALQGIRGAVVSQTKSRIGKNPVMARMYGDGLDDQPTAAAAPQGKPVGTTNKPDGTYSKGGKTYTVKGGQVYE